MTDPGDLIAMALTFGAGIVVFRPLAKAFATRIASGGTRAVEAEQVRQLESRLADTTYRLAATEADLSRMSEKVEFLEKVIAKPRTAPKLTAAGVGAGD